MLAVGQLDIEAELAAHGLDIAFQRRKLDLGAALFQVGNRGLRDAKDFGQVALRQLQLLAQLRQTKL